LGSPERHLGSPRDTGCRDRLRRSTETQLPARRVLGGLGLRASKYFDGKQRYGQANEHNTQVPRDHWLEAWEQEAIGDFGRAHPRDGYRRLTFMMLDQDVVAVSPAWVYRVRAKAGCSSRGRRRRPRRGRGSGSRWTRPEHWHTDISSLTICGTCSYLGSVLDGCSRANLQWGIRESMTEREVELVLQKAKEKYPEAKPRVISDNGPSSSRATSSSSSGSVGWTTSARRRTIRSRTTRSSAGTAR
jgi:hypothetical protein